MTEKPQAVRVHPAIRLGGAFMAVAVVLAVMVFIGMSTRGIFSTAEINPRLLCIVLAAALIGAFAPAAAGRRDSTSRIVALFLAVVLAIGSRFVPNPTFYVVEQGWLVAYAILFLLASLILRRQTMKP
ncbi:hypothetical protein [Corynebacterium aquilae]|uniref:Uncharacterized protein n=1 Tax=Corynebacterium aquilae DSM 44791 TaxID=1431546 RepID=A0A1L7CG18_9CORY|nr:hypothetical protein [Corynebacterium aquilae]APT84766.1 hypothetical protein CAQU_06435 [Corynebacterium aquilae DSM 44791]